MSRVDDINALTPVLLVRAEDRSHQDGGIDEEVALFFADGTEIAFNSCPCCEGLGVDIKGKTS